MRSILLPRIAAVLVIAVAQPLLAAVAWSSAPAERPKFKNLPYEEDWSVLREGGGDELLDPIKYIPFDEDGDFWMSFGGQLRGRLEIWRSFNFGTTTPADDTFFLTRIRFHTDLHLTKFVRVFAEFKSALSTERILAGGRRTVDVDTAALQNAFMELKLPLENVDLSVMGGRRELQFGVQRLVSPLDWANARRTFDGGSGHARGDTWEATGFWSLPVIVDKYDFNGHDDSTPFYGIYSAFDLPWDDLRMELYWLGLSFDAERTNPTNPFGGPGSRHTIGTRIFGDIPHTPLRFDLEGGAQVGDAGSSDILAGMVSMMFTWPFADVLFEPAVFLGYDWASGDSGPGGNIGTFDQLFPLGHAYLGLIDVTARQNIQVVQGGAQFSPFNKTLFKMNWLAFWLVDVNDSLYAVGGGAVAPPNPTATSDYVGTEVDLTFTYDFGHGLTTLVGYSHFFTGKYISQTLSADEDQDFGYISLQYTF